MDPMRFRVNTVDSANRVEGLLVSGQLNKDESIAIVPSGQQTSILSIEAIDKKGEKRQLVDVEAELALELTYSVSVNVGDIIAPADLRPEFADQFEAKVNWLSEQALLPGKLARLQALPP